MTVRIFGKRIARVSAASASHGLPRMDAVVSLGRAPFALIFLSAAPGHFSFQARLGAAKSVGLLGGVLILLQFGGGPQRLDADWEGAR